jgi:hypothetical protein
MPKPLTSVNSPLAEAVLEPLTAKMLQEVLQSRDTTAAQLAQPLCLPVPLIEAAMKGQCALKVGVWKAILATLKATSEDYKFRPNEHGSEEYWELYNVFMVPSPLWRRLFPLCEP